jgi:nucleoid DNA-binding protein
MVYTDEELFAYCARIAKRFSDLSVTLITEVWEAVCRYIENQLMNGKAASLVGLGKFSFQVKKMNNGTKGTIEQRQPVFELNESFVRTYCLRRTKQLVSNEV